jgi:hypothetical protein
MSEMETNSDADLGDSVPVWIATYILIHVIIDCVSWLTEYFSRADALSKYNWLLHSLWII